MRNEQFRLDVDGIVQHQLLSHTRRFSDDSENYCPFLESNFEHC